MADRIGAFGRHHMAPSGTLLQLGAKRAASVLWKAVVKGDRKGVELIFAKFAFRQEARDAVASAKNVLKAEGNLIQGLDGLSRLLERTRQDSKPPTSDYPAVLQAYRLALFDAAWDATIGKGKLGIRLTVRDGTKHNHEVRASIKDDLRSYAGVGNWRSVGDTIGDLQENHYLPQYRLGGHEMLRTVGEDPATDLSDVPRMPRGVSAATGSNYRMCDRDTTEWRPPPYVTILDTFAITRDNGALAVSLGGGPNPVGSVNACEDLNQFLLTGEPTELNPLVGGYGARPLPDGDLLVTPRPRNGQTLLAFDPGRGFVEIATADLSKPLPRDVTLRQGAFLVSLSDGACNALGQVGAAALDEALGPEKLGHIAKIGDLQDALSDLIAARTMKAIERKEKALEQHGTFKLFADAGQLEKLLQVQPTIDMINAMLDGAYPHPDAVPRKFRVSMNQTEEEFRDSLQRCANALSTLRSMILQPLGGDITIVVVDPIKALGIDRTAAKPPAPTSQPV